MKKTQVRDRLWREILKARRDALQPEDFGLEPRPDRRPGPTVTGLLQTDVDLIMKKPVGTYGRLESGRLRPTAEYLVEVARQLRLDNDQYTYVHLELFQTEPVLPLDPDAGLCVPPDYQRALDGQQHMAYITDRRYDVRMYNAAFTEMFLDGKVPGNTMRWMLLSEEARDHTLSRWDVEWGPRVMPQFRAALAAHPEDPVHNRLLGDILEDRRARRIYDRMEDAYIHPDGDRRPLHHATLGPGWVTMIAEQPLSSPGARHMTLLFDPS
ncbi:XRE family transcriptional regulator [Streptomyces sp. NPDC056672]|uniref:MmyB family transcriptional regulator n=1 Tax=Streptomyces sp. NPDC056672 TaxID=3345906 RepID=UPI00367F1965